MRVSLSPVRNRPVVDTVSAPRSLLKPGGARIVIGQETAADGLVAPISPSPHALFGPRGATLAGANGPLFVCDTGHHRLLIWTHPPERDRQDADFVIGQADFFREGRNGKTSPGAATLNVPTGVAAADGVLAVADAWNHRVLIWHGYPMRSNQPADVVLGQNDFESVLANRGTGTAAADHLNWCYGVTIHDGSLYVADTGNRRVLKWLSIPASNGTPADLVLGEVDFITRDENAGRATDAAGMRWPHGIAIDRHGRFMVADAGNNRVMVWDAMPDRNGAPCSFVLGQRDCFSVDHNQTAYYPAGHTLNMPYGLVLIGDTLITADTANCRLVGHDLASLAMNAPAVALAGQHTYQDKGENGGWGQIRRHTLCWPYGVSACEETLVIADSGNNRVLLWEAQP